MSNIIIHYITKYHYFICIPFKNTEQNIYYIIAHTYVTSFKTYSKTLNKRTFNKSIHTKM